MTEDDIFKISQRLCERGLLRCACIEDGMPRYELTVAGWTALLRTEKAST
jgi:hypothetical protein